MGRKRLAAARDHQYGNWAFLFFQNADDRNPVFLGHQNVCDYDVEFALIELAYRLFAIFTRSNIGAGSLQQIG